MLNRGQVMRRCPRRWSVPCASRPTVCWERQLKPFISRPAEGKSNGVKFSFTELVAGLAGCFESLAPMDRPWGGVAGVARPDLQHLWSQCVLESQPRTFAAP